MYEETKSSIDWKGIFLKVIIAFLIVLIAVKGYTTLKGNNDKKVETTTETTAESKSSSTFTANIEKLRDAGEKYYTTNEDKLPKTEGTTTMVTLNELINEGVIEALADEDGKTCDGESSYVTAVLEGEKTKIKANLVCGSASSYSLVYMGENDTEVTEDKTETSTSSSYSNSTSSSSSKKTTSSTTKTTSTNCGNSCATPSVTVSTNTTVSQNVSINTDKKPTTNSNTTNNKYYTVSFDSNGGSREYSSQNVLENNTAYNPGTTTKSGYTFKGWYLNGKKYDFSTPVTKNITLVAKFTKISYYEDDEEDYKERDTEEINVYTMGWHAADIDKITVNHTLRLPESLEDADEVRIKNIEFYKPINTVAQANTYANKLDDTFFYSSNGWESASRGKNSLATISSATFNYDREYKDVYEAIREGFDVTWTSKYISKRCSNPFNVYGPNGDVATNVCNYGIVYTVTWEYINY